MGANQPYWLLCGQLGKGVRINYKGAMEAMGEQAAEKLLWQTRTSLTYTFGVTGEHHAGCSKRPTSKAAGESKPEAYPRGCVEDFDEPRTKLTDFFSILLRVQVG